MDLRNPKLKKRHWEEIEKTLNHTFDNEVKPPSKHLLSELLELNVQVHQEALQLISTAATAEGALVDLYAVKVTAVWKDMDFIVNPYKEQRDSYILGSVEDIQQALDESLVQLNTILGSRYCKPIREEVMKSQKKLMLLSDTLVSIQSEGAAREWSTVVDISMTPPSFKLVPLSLSRSPISKTPKQVIF